MEDFWKHKLVRQYNYSNNWKQVCGFMKLKQSFEEQTDVVETAWSFQLESLFCLHACNSKPSYKNKLFAVMTVTHFHRWFGDADYKHVCPDCFWCCSTFHTRCTWISVLLCAVARVFLSSQAGWKTSHRSHTCKSFRQCGFSCAICWIVPETFSTHATHKWFLPRVNAFVVL